MNIYVLLNTELGWDNIVCIADSLEAMAFSVECVSVESLHKMVDDDVFMHLIEREIETLPEETLEESIQKHWS